MLPELGQFLHARTLQGPGRQTCFTLPRLSQSMALAALPLYLITQPVLIDLGLGVAVVHGYLLAQDVEGAAGKSRAQ